MSKNNLALKRLSSFSFSLEMEEWEESVSVLKRFIRLNDENRGLFFALLGKESDLDSYATSPVYYAFTGRKGLWLYQDGNAYVPLCWHPNVDGQILVFPPRGQYHPTILKKVLTEMPIPPAGVSLARVKAEEICSEPIHSISGSIGRSISTSLVNEEPVLDWRYPVRILSTEKVAKAKGKAFMKTRNNIRQMEQYSVSVLPISMARTSQIVEFVNRWARARSQNSVEIKELVAPYLETISLLKDEVFNVGGQMFFVDDLLQAVTLWERPNTAMKIANVWMNLCDTQIRGLSEFVVQKTSQELLALGIPYANYGGSETKGLDFYKRKYDPAYSLELKSIGVDIKGVDVILNSLIRIQTRVAA